MVHENSPVVQCLALCTFTAKDAGSIPGWGTKILQGTWHSQKKKQKTKKDGSARTEQRYEKVLPFKITGGRPVLADWNQHTRTTSSRKGGLSEERRGRT